MSVNILTLFSELLANLISYRTDAVTKILKLVEAPDAMRPETPAAQTEVHATPPKTVCLENAVPRQPRHVVGRDAMMLEPCVVPAAAHVRAARRVVRAAACLEQQAILVVHQDGAEQALLAAKRRRNAVQLEAYAVRELV